ncbi:cytochrome C oxidase subunit IV family protein [Acidovorax radicis]|jgi:4-hydroxybenzoate polyprenyltransferase|uniref:cytochrome C oxidase subunit IV family protein n=1 Tax=Acidovorax radicis TaxID=758826 RepID=UPI001CFB4235|nr:cytochrome C oxidase subunit IV family protein [Acidovorax radicis]UCU99491.1 cytochrome C oxidase subunit IV family protein [Acidovorax radicis]
MTAAPRIRTLWGRHGATLTWLALLALTAASVAMAGHAQHGGSRLWMTIAVAALAWTKGWLLVRHYLEAHHAGPVFLRIVMLFGALAPLGLIACAVHEALRH